MKSIPAFSKKMTGGGIATGPNSQRSGFTPHVTVTKLAKAKQVPSMAANYPVKSTIGHTSGPSKAHPNFKGKSDSGIKKFPAFSKKKI
jgi:hypothetical protein